VRASKIQVDEIEKFEDERIRIELVTLPKFIGKNFNLWEMPK